MNFRTYQIDAKKTAVYPKTEGIVYCAMGVANEAGELLGKVKKQVRGDYELIKFSLDGAKELTDEGKELCDEIGDVLWYLALLSEELGTTLNLIAENNLCKLADRAARNQIKGSGDNR
jgi:NTP pyrophosphatase (non-canonical NTP hydrolase)